MVKFSTDSSSSVKPVKVKTDEPAPVAETKKTASKSKAKKTAEKKETKE